MTDIFRTMCVELVELSAPTDSIPQLAERLQKLAELANRARAALAQPEPVAPTQSEAVAVYTEVMAAHDCQTLGDMAEHFARAVLARWGTPAIAAELEAL
jgi:hypothetical protein